MGKSDVPRSDLDPGIDYIPRRYGYAEALKSISTVSAPFLAGFAFTAALLVVQFADKMRFPDETLAVLAGAFVVLIASTQGGFWAAGYYSTYKDALDWWTDKDDPDRQVSVRTGLAEDYRTHRRWALFASVTYDAGILLFLAGFALALVPPGTLGVRRLEGLIIVGLGFVGELVWTVLKIVRW